MNAEIVVEGSSNSLPAHTLPRGTMLRDYRVDRVLGEGGFGIVYLATDAALQRQVAVKEYLPSSMAARAGDGKTVVIKSAPFAETFALGLKSFVNEAQLLARFNHSSLVKVHQFWEEHGTAYMVMPYYEGPTLKSALARLGRTPTEAEINAWLMPLLDALEVLHADNCYHRDIAPDNILLTTNGPLLLDFGAARRVIGDLTHALTEVLKPGYSPIEQYGNMPDVDQGPWTDIFALGSVLYSVIGGVRPVPSVERVIADRMKPLAELAAGRFRHGFLAAVDHALALLPEHRPRNVADFRALLAAGEAAPASPPAPPLVPLLPTHIPSARAPLTAITHMPESANVGTRCFRFGNIEIRYTPRLLLVDGEPTTLGARAFDLLSALIERRDRVVSKSELLKLVWRGLVVEDNNIQVQVSALRRVVGANAVATVPGYGYRFVLPVVESLLGQPPPVLPLQSARPASLTNLARPPNSFIGRVKEMAEVKSLYGRTRLLTLTGVGGCGKTRLAQQLGADLLALYPDGVWWVELAALRDPDLVPMAVAAVMRCGELAGKAMAQRLSEHLATKKLLLVLDNAEHVLAACAQLVETVLAQCSNVCLLVTSREGLRAVGELTYRVPPLSTPDPIRDTTPERLMVHPSACLFFDRATFHRPQLQVTLENAPAVASICHRLDGIPLAIELAAARVRAMSVAEVNERLDHGMGLLSSGSRTAASRQQTLRSLIDWSYDLLSEPEQALLRRLATFAGGWTLAAAEQICIGRGIEDWAVLDILAALVDKSLVQAEDRGKTTRYGLLETMRQYALDRMRESGETAHWQNRHLTYFVAVTEEAEPHLTHADQIDWLGRLEAEHPNMRAALSWSMDGEGSLADGLRLAGALDKFWTIRGHFSEGSAWLGRLLKAGPDSQSTQYRAKALRAAGQMAWMQGDFAAARPLFQESLALRRTLGDRKGIAESLNGLGTCALNQGDYSAARTMYDEALATLRELGDRLALAPILGNLGLVANNLGDHVAATALYTEGLLIDREVGDRNAIAISLTNLGTAVRGRGDVLAAVALTEEALAIFRELGNQKNVAWSLSNLGSFACGQGRLHAARASFMECLAIRRDLGDRWGLPSSIEGLGGVEASMNWFLRAAKLWGAAEGLREAFGIPLSPLARGQSERANEKARAALGDDPAFERSWQEGRAMNLDEALTFALEEHADTP